MNITIDNNIIKRDPRVDYVVKQLGSAKSSDVISIILIFNNGGSTPAIEKLIYAIDRTKAQVRLVFSGYAVSSAAYLFAYYTFQKKSFSHVFVYVKRSLCLVYHRPRSPLPLSLTGEVIFANTLVPPFHSRYQYLINVTKKFDLVFERMMDHFRISGATHIAQNAESVYDFNGDVQIMFDAGKYK